MIGQQVFLEQPLVGRSRNCPDLPGRSLWNPPILR